MARSAGSETVQVRGLNQLLRALKAFPKEAQAELRDEANSIATTLMLPSWQAAARTVQPQEWGAALAAGIRVKRDRVPALSIGYKRPALSGGNQGSKKGASSVQLRWPTYSGDAGASWAPFMQTNWIDRATGYKAEAMERYGDAIERVVRDWNRGGI